MRSFENFKLKPLPTKKSNQKKDQGFDKRRKFTEFPSQSDIVHNPEMQSKAELVDHTKDGSELVTSKQDNNILAQKEDLLNKLKSLTGGQVVAVTLDKVNKNKIETHEYHKDDADKDVVTNKQVSMHKKKMMSSKKEEINSDQKAENIFKNFQNNNQASSNFKFYQSDSKRVKKAQHKRQDRQLKDFDSFERKQSPRNENAFKTNDFIFS